MDKQFFRKANDLYQRIKNRLNSPKLESDSEYITVYDLRRIVSEAMKDYNDVLINQVSSEAKELNKKIAWSNFLRGKFPYISECFPTIDEKGDTYIAVTFCNYEGVFAGKAIINSDGSVTITRLDGYKGNNALKVLELLRPLFQRVLGKLNEFKEEYPGNAYTWFEDSLCETGKQEVQDDLLHCTINISKPDKASVSLVSSEDIELANEKVPRHGKLYDYIDFYNDDFMKRLNVNIEDLKPLFKDIVKKNYKLENGETRKLD